AHRVGSENRQGGTRATGNQERIRDSEVPFSPKSVNQRAYEQDREQDCDRSRNSDIRPRDCVQKGKAAKCPKPVCQRCRCRGGRPRPRPRGKDVNENEYSRRKQSAERDNLARRNTPRSR